MPTHGQRISEYLLDSRIGAGTFGEVWRANHHVWAQQVVAIKLPNNSDFIRDLQREGLAVRGLDHPNVVRAMGFDPYADPPYLVMEYVPGQSLRQLIRQGSLKIEDALSIMRQVLAGLAYAHGQGIVHRDLKPENVLIHEDAASKGYAHPGAVKITDFGFGQRSAPQAGSIVYSMSLDPEQAKKIVGTIDYMSPEQRAGDTVDARSDLYACGVMLFEMLTGEKPSGTEVPGDLRQHIPGWVNDAFRRSYTRLDRRFVTATEMASALHSQPPAMPNPIQKARAPGTLSGCPRCQRPIGANDQFCMHCGVQLVNFVRRCPHCGAYPDHDDEFCTHCGKTLSRMRLAT